MKDHLLYKINFSFKPKGHISEQSESFCNLQSWGRLDHRNSKKVFVEIQWTNPIFGGHISPRPKKQYLKRYCEHR